MKFEFPRRIFAKDSNIKFHEKPSSGSRVLPRGRPDGRMGGRTERRTGLKKLMVAFRKFAISSTKLHYDIMYMCFWVHITSDDICARSCLLVRIRKFHGNGFWTYEGCSDIEYTVIDSRCDEEGWYIFKFVFIFNCYLYKDAGSSSEQRVVNVRWNSEW